MVTIFRRILRLKLFVCAGTAFLTLPLATVGAARQQVPAKASATDTPALQKEIISKLSGYTEIRTGVRLANRTTIENKREARNYLAEIWKRLGMSPRRQTR